MEHHTACRSSHRRLRVATTKVFTFFAGCGRRPAAKPRKRSAAAAKIHAAQAAADDGAGPQPACS